MKKREEKKDGPLSRLSVKKIIVCVYAYRPKYEMWLKSASDTRHTRDCCEQPLMGLAEARQ